MLSGKDKSRGGSRGAGWGRRVPIAGRRRPPRASVSPSESMSGRPLPNLCKFQKLEDQGYRLLPGARGDLYSGRSGPPGARAPLAASDQVSQALACSTVPPANSRRHPPEGEESGSGAQRRVRQGCWRQAGTPPAPPTSCPVMHCPQQSQGTQGRLRTHLPAGKYRPQRGLQGKSGFSTLRDPS